MNQVWKVCLLCVLIIPHAFSAQIARIKGDVFINAKAAKKKQKLKAGDIIKAQGKNSFFVIVYDDGSKVLIKDGVLRINKMEQKEVEYGLIRGLFYSYINPKAKTKHNIKTKFAAMGVRGTKFWLREEMGESYLCVCDGSVEVSKDNKSILVSRNQDIRVTHETKNLEVKTASPPMWALAVEGLADLGVSVKPLIPFIP